MDGILKFDTAFGHTSNVPKHPALGAQIILA